VKSNTATCITAEIRIGYLQDRNLKLEPFVFVANVCGRSSEVWMRESALGIVCTRTTLRFLTMTLPHDVN
jgi:hypothetical protein